MRQVACPPIPYCRRISDGAPERESLSALLRVATKVAELGAYDVYYTMVRLNGQIGEIFSDWARKTIPDRADRILNQIAETHSGALNDSRFKTRMRGEGVIADQVKATMLLAKKKYLQKKKLSNLDFSYYLQLKDPQMKLF